MNPKLIYPEESFAIRGCLFEVYRNKGAGFLEPVYQECLEIEFPLSDVPAIPQPGLQLDYKGTKLRSEYIPDFICYEKIIVELKAVKELTESHRAQVQNYHKATGFKPAFLVNFCHHPLIEIERIVL
ncbi:MAG: GxxExxY protein [Prosthecobacter sp.]|uniref:GxxExxY protein n=1 Tax=Prosthecobacter sp. TaxID=1965333 RepID=UPI0025DBF4F9|nr:GxxExxY protein [Prosthecobacter sp.]MCF7784535.1 GxxExxY protein [Prosthecobacter sp.]